MDQKLNAILFSGIDVSLFHGRLDLTGQVGRGLDRSRNFFLAVAPNRPSSGERIVNDLIWQYKNSQFRKRFDVVRCEEFE
jgi:hypothetical protein